MTTNQDITTLAWLMKTRHPAWRIELVLSKYYDECSDGLRGDASELQVWKAEARIWRANMLVTTKKDLESIEEDIRQTIALRSLTARQLRKMSRLSDHPALCLKTSIPFGEPGQTV